MGHVVPVRVPWDKGTGTTPPYRGCPIVLSHRVEKNRAKVDNDDNGGARNVSSQPGKRVVLSRFTFGEPRTVEASREWWPARVVGAWEPNRPAGQMRFRAATIPDNEPDNEIGRDSRSVRRRQLGRTEPGELVNAGLQQKGQHRDND